MDEATHDGGDGELLLLGVLEETQDVVADDDAGLAAELLKDTHDGRLDCSERKKVVCKIGGNLCKGRNGQEGKSVPK